MRLHLFEFEDFDWFPGLLRSGQTDYLHFVIKMAGIYKPAVPLVKELVEKSDSAEILDLCSGGGGGIDVFQKDLQELTGRKIKITISDKYPNIDAFEHIKETSKGKVDFSKEPIDATNVPDKFRSIRTIFSAFHHFEPEDAKKILKDATDRGVPIAVFEGTNKDVLNFLGILIFTPVIFFFITPFMRPFRLSRLIFTYLIPLIPIVTTWDGIVSILRMYTPRQMLEMAEEVTGNQYVWKAGKAKGRSRNTVLYLVGYPADNTGSKVTQ
jgi:hypothetical protein